jgi:chromosome segregation ATPase
LDNLKAKMAQLNTEIQRQIANYRLAREEKTKAADDVLKAKTPEEKASLQAVNEQKATALADIYARAKEVAAQRRQVEQQLQVLTQKEAAVRERTQRSIDKLERLQENLRKQRTMRTSQREALPSIAAPIERFTTPIETRDAEGNVKTRATPAQLVADWVEALSSGADTTQQRAALETVLGQIQRAGAGEKEALT